MRPLPLLLLFLLSYTQLGDTVVSLDWCQYWRLLKQDHTRVECNGVFRVRLARHRSAEQLVETNRVDGGGRQVRPAPPIHIDTLPSLLRFKSTFPQRALVSSNRATIEQCLDSFYECRPSQLCDGGLLCNRPAGYCCAPFQPPRRSFPIRACPPPQSLTPVCRMSVPVSWCGSSFHCHTTPDRLCCPTSCGYNVCV